MAQYNVSTISDFAYRICLSTSFDETVNSVEILLKRVGVKTIWANIQPVRGSFYLNGTAQREGRDAYSHIITIRFNPLIDISGYAWVFEHRRSGDRWYKILAVEEVDESSLYWKLSCRLQQKGGDIVAPEYPKGVEPLPTGVEL